MSKVEASTKSGGKTLLKSVKDFKFDNATVNNKITDHVVQRCVDNPLLVDGMEHEIRLFLIVASVDPFVVFLNEEGLVTFEPNSALNLHNNTKMEEISENSLGDGKDNQNSKEDQNLRRNLSSYWNKLEKLGFDIRQVNFYN